MSWCPMEASWMSLKKSSSGVTETSWRWSTFHKFIFSCTVSCSSAPDCILQRILWIFVSVAVRELFSYMCFVMTSENVPSVVQLHVETRPIIKAVAQFYRSSKYQKDIFHLCHLILWTLNSSVALIITVIVILISHFVSFTSSDNTSPLSKRYQQYKNQQWKSLFFYDA